MLQQEDRRMPSADAAILREGRNCWRFAPAGRASVLVDADAYFSALAHALAKAERSVLMLCWDIDSRLDLLPPGAAKKDFRLPSRLGALLHHLLRRRPELEIHILSWDFAVLYAFERESFPLLNPAWRSHRRLHFFLDGMHPLGASHHQKIIVIDDRMAFLGGLDPTARRWDTPSHGANDPRRVDPWGRRYAPFHDVQIAVDGQAAAALGDVARDRWRRATGQVLPRPSAGGDPWPRSVQPDLEDVEVAISRTDPAYDERGEVLEVESLWFDAIAAARRSIYLESQYLTATKMGEALARRLEEPDGRHLSGGAGQPAGAGGHPLQGAGGR